MPANSACQALPHTGIVARLRLDHPARRRPCRQIAGMARSYRKPRARRQSSDLPWLRTLSHTCLVTFSLMPLPDRSRLLPSLPVRMPLAPSL